MKLVSYLAAALAIAAAIVSPASAEPVPDRATGIWSLAECGGDGLTVLLNSNTALMVDAQEEHATVAMARAEWLSGSVMLTMEGKPEELVLPPLPLDDFERCDAPPFIFSLLFAESVTMFREVDDIEARCTGEDVDAAPCVALVFGLIDISEDGVFSKAELSRAVRAASFFIGYGLAVEESQSPFVPMEKLSVAWFAASLLGPFVATNLIDSYDFDGDGLLSLKELLQDRTSEEGIHGVAAGLAAEVPPEMMSGLMKAANGLFKMMQ